VPRTHIEHKYGPWRLPDLRQGPFIYNYCREHRQAAGAFAEAQRLARDYLRDRSIRDRRVMGLVSNHRSGGYDSESNGRK
jgi:hypothetical protein